MDDMAEIRRWLEEFSAAVRDADYTRGTTMVAPDVVGFGTYGGVLVGRDALVAGQWRNVWSVTRGFTFRLDELHGEANGDRAWVALPWDSQGRDERGAWYDRPGRATMVLERRDGRWLAVHTHFSLYPPTAARAAH